jgi:hypothetical protein
VLSDSTEAFDRGDKFADYKSIPELEEYVLVHQKQVLVERFQRKSDNLWVPQIYRAGDRVTSNSIGLTCPITPSMKILHSYSYRQLDYDRQFKRPVDSSTGNVLATLATAIFRETGQ